MNPDRLLALYDRVADAPDAVPRLRRFVLDLAVRGKLVAQDPEDEPASILLERIAAEKARLVKTGAIRKSRKDSDLSADDPYDLPEKWLWTAFGELHHLMRGVTYSKSDVSEAASVGYVPVLRANNIGPTLTHDDPVYVKSERIGSDQYLRRGDYMIALSSGSKNLVGKAALVPADLDEAFGGFCGAVRLYDSDSVGFVGVFLSSDLYRESISAGSRGIGINNLKREVLANLHFPLPPFAEQRRIVAKVEELMALLDRLEAAREEREATRDRLVAASLARLTALDTEPEAFATYVRFALDALPALTTRSDQIKALRQTILNLAVRGKLVEQEPADEPASVGRIELEFEQPFSAPPGWHWVPFSAVAAFENGDRSKKYPKRAEYVSAGVPWINTGHIEPDGSLSQSTMNYITEEKFESLGGGKIKPGDLLYCLRGATFGKTAYVEPFEKGAIASSLMIIRPGSLIDRRYTYIYLTSPLGREQLHRFDNGTAQPNLSSASVKKYLIPLPPLAEQHRIVARVDALMALCDRLEASLTATAATRCRLLDALLAEALAPAEDRELEAAE